LGRAAVATLLAFGALIFAHWFIEAGSGPTTVSIAPASRDLETQTTGTFTITVEDATDLGGFEFDLTFDPAHLQIDGVAPGDFLGSTGRNIGELGPTIDNVTGTLSYGGFSFGSQAGPTGTGTLAVVSYTTTLTEGTSALDLQNVQILDTDAQTQPVQTIDGSVSVLSGPRIGVPTFDTDVASDESLTVTVPITNTIDETGVATAAIRCGYVSPYTQATVAGSGPGGDGNGTWTFTIPPQGDAREGQTLHFSLAARDGDTPTGETIDDNDGSNYTVTVTDDDTEPPTFSNPAPVRGISVYSFTLQVDITDTESALTDNQVVTESVYAAWDTDGELSTDANTVDMDWISETAYAIDAPIGPFASGVTVTWRVYAEDDDNSPTSAWSPTYTTLITDTVFGDLDYDGDVDVEDIMIPVAHWNTAPGDPGYNAAYDFDGDGDIDVRDVMLVAAAWGNTLDGAAGRMSTPSDLVQDGPRVSFQPSPATVQAGEAFTVDVTIADVTDLGGFEFDLLFDPQAITVTGVHLGDFLAHSGNSVSALGPRYEGDGRLVFGGFSYGAHDGASGDGVLATLDLMLLSEAETVLRLEDMQLVDGEATSMAPGAVGEGLVQTSNRVYLPLVLRKS
jgi:hypothetical protein